MTTPPSGEDQITIHGTLVWLGNEGILLRGEAGVGKSTTALTLMAGGGQLVADDLVVIKRVGALLYGSAPPLLKGILAIPDLGIFDVREVVGRNYFTPSSVITRCVDLGWVAETTDGECGAEFHGIRLPRTFRKLESSHETSVFSRGIDLVSVKKSETRFLMGHARVVASSRAG